MFAPKKRDGFNGERHVVLPSIAYTPYLNHPLVNFSYISEIGFYPSARYHYRERITGLEEYIFIYCISGKGTIEIYDQTVIELNAGSIFCIPPHQKHCYYANETDPWSIFWFHFNSRTLSQLIENNSQMVQLDSYLKNEIIQNHLTELFSICEREFSLNNLFCISHLLDLILIEIFYLEDSLKKDKKNQYLVHCINFMKNNLHENLSLYDLAAPLKISSSYLSLIFKEYTQKSPIEYLIHMRIEHACKLMKVTDLKIQEIAKKVGYHDPYYFSRIFKKIIGQSPKEYRRASTNQKRKFLDMKEPNSIPTHIYN